MLLLSVAVALVGVLCLVDLVLTLGVIRRLRDHSKRLSGANGFPTGETVGRPGMAVDSFSATSLTGEPATLDDLVEPTLVGFFAANCPTCEEQLPAFLTYAATFPGGKQRILAVITTEAGGVRYRSALSEVAAKVVVEPELGPVQQAFGVNGYPAFVVVIDGVVAQSGHDIADLPAPQPV